MGEENVDLNKIELSAKAAIALDIIKLSCKSNEKVLLFTHSLSVLDYFEEILRDNSISFDRLDGSTTQKNISKITKKFDFNRSGSTSVLLISTKSASFALNLTSATRVIIMGMSFNPQDAEQAIGRVIIDMFRVKLL
ncbi:hypothetical protein HK098_000997 [Nowakowskiella sp. JEL0407]|nr:hypothetical protein HK098_000997 [Nowakowskiella sp. JEL0407]